MGGVVRAFRAASGAKTFACATGSRCRERARARHQRGRRHRRRAARHAGGARARLALRARRHARCWRRSATPSLTPRRSARCWSTKVRCSRWRRPCATGGMRLRSRPGRRCARPCCRCSRGSRCASVKRGASIRRCSRGGSRSVRARRPHDALDRGVARLRARARVRRSRRSHSSRSRPATSSRHARCSADGARGASSSCTYARHLARPRPLAARGIRRARARLGSRCEATVLVSGSLPDAPIADEIAGVRSALDRRPDHDRDVRRARPGGGRGRRMDSGPMHVAAAVGAPTVGVFALRSDEPGRWAPLGPRAAAVRGTYPCPWPTARRHAPIFRASVDLPAAEILAAVDRLRVN